MQCRVAKVLALRFFILQMLLDGPRREEDAHVRAMPRACAPLTQHCRSYSHGLRSARATGALRAPSRGLAGAVDGGCFGKRAMPLRRGRGAQRSPGKGRHHGLPARAHGRRGSRGGETGGLRRPAAAGPLPSLRRHSWRTAVCRHWALRPGAQGTAPGLPAEPDERTSAPLEQNLALKRACRSARRAWHLQPTRKDMDVIRIQAGLHEAPKETPRDTVDSRSVGARKSRRPRRPFNRTERGPDCATLNSVGSSGVAVSLGGSASQECNLERLRQRRRRSNAA
ncbi:unnamed protein product [Prorocentrum cordatum]|uniref:Uncharacterized protein n=1 Tax=Prorocentrum cordatum TaxID=2364126 RepID=A0ABN9WFL6_9DINO|nr:unnamed protein product [Polarella glacialis]